MTRPHLHLSDETAKPWMTRRAAMRNYIDTVTRTLRGDARARLAGMPRELRPRAVRSTFVPLRDGMARFAR